MTELTVSIVVPVYNAEQHLDASVGSLLAQSYRDIEVILVDDGSTDSSGAICDAFALRDPRVRVLHQANGGIGAAQNAGLDIASGRLITFCDDDDLVSPTMIGRLVQILLDNDADMSCCRWRNVGASVAARELSAHAADEPGETIVFMHPARRYQTVFSLVARKILRRELMYMSEANWGKLYRAELFEGIRFPEGSYAQDVAVAMDLYRRMHRVASCSDMLYFWVQHPHSVSHRVTAASYYGDMVRAHARSFAMAVEMGILPARALGGLRAVVKERQRAVSEEEVRTAAEHERLVDELVAGLSWRQRAVCRVLHALRVGEIFVYDRTVHRRH